ncbi:MAG TPA: pyridoxamine 5'-phosphate oxidase family protein [Polyangiaceae bacterium]|jgi:nitroimidazol reductase NimA-like FMN-containing flavoprotein (pyridoxamine 5'-phosphate oxidase superfamily)|nr:pyridoxamine 5'-phosphate oxidase family protein [Polyangiaceae bacterium]
MSTSHPEASTERTRVRRLPKRAAYDRPTIDAILDEALVCHVGLSSGAQPFVIPTVHWRIGDELYIHGSAASRMIEHAGEGLPLCITVTLIDGLVLARSAFHHSMNYRSVVILGQARVVVERQEKLDALAALVNRLAPGRAAHVRAPNPQELKATSVLALPIIEASAKVRRGGPIDDEDDLALPVWAGAIPLRLQALTAVASEPQCAGAEVPSLGFPFNGGG